MRGDLKLLIKLQELDQTVAKLNATKGELASGVIQAEKDAEAERRNLENRIAETKSFRTALGARDIELKEIEEKIARLQLQINIVKTNREYTALQHEILGLKAGQSKIEDEILSMMEQEDSGKAEIEDLGRRVEEAVEAARQCKQAAERAICDADARIERLSGERAELAAGEIPQNWLATYERLRQKGDGRAMAACRNFVCEGCRMSLTANTVNLLMTGEKLIHCHSCGRILYLAGGEDVRSGIGAGRKA